MKRILITGKDSYIGESFKNFISSKDYCVDTADMLDPSWRELDFSRYDAVFHVAGIVHIKETADNAQLYYKINRDLAVEVASKAKSSAVALFIYMSSMSVYGKTTGVISKDTVPLPVTNYGKSKLEAENKLLSLADSDFSVAVLRPPIVYGNNCKGNYVTMSRFAKKLPFFPDYDNKRSMIYSDNFCSFVKKVIDKNLSGIFCPQNSEYVKTADMVRLIANENGRKIRLTRLFNPLISLAIKLRIPLICKVFSSLVYDDSLQLDFEQTDFEKTVQLTEKPPAK